MASNQNQMGPGGPGGEFYVDTAMKPTVIKPIGGGYVSNVNTFQQPQNNQQTNNQKTNNQKTADPMLTQQLKSIVSQKDVFQNLAGQPKYLTNKFKHLFPKGNIPYSEMTGQQKAIADFYQGTTPNAYQQQIQNFMMSSPEAAATYKDMFPVGGSFNYAMTTMPEKIMEKTMLGQGLKALTGAIQNVYPAISENFVKTKQAAKDMVDTSMSGAEAAASKVEDIFQDALTNQTVDPATGLKKYENQIFVRSADGNKYVDKPYFTAQSIPVASPLSGISSLLNTSTDTPLRTPPERIFALPGGQTATLTTQVPYNPNLGYQTTGNYLTMNPELERLQMKNLPTGMAEGGLASLNNPDYGMLMNASNFGF